MLNINVRPAANMINCYFRTQRAVFVHAVCQAREHDRTETSQPERRWKDFPDEHGWPHSKSLSARIDNTLD